VATRTLAIAGISVGWLTLWSLIGIAAAWFIYDSVVYVATRDPQPGATLLNRQIWYVSHMAIATPILLTAPVQFLAGFRGAKPQVHRWLGRAFLSSSVIAGALAVWLGATIQYQGSRIPLALFGLVWIGFSAAAWVCARKRDYANHRKFVIRSFAIGLAFVWVRVLGSLEDHLFPFIANPEVRDTSQEFLSFVLPLLIVELWLSWLPPVRAALRRIEP
jgi:uncharacterized membrane protein